MPRPATFIWFLHVHPWRLLPREPPWNVLALVCSLLHPHSLQPLALFVCRRSPKVLALHHCYTRASRLLRRSPTTSHEVHRSTARRFPLTLNLQLPVGMRSTEVMSTFIDWRGGAASGFAGGYCSSSITIGPPCHHLSCRRVSLCSSRSTHAPSHQSNSHRPGTKRPLRI